MPKVKAIGAVLKDKSGYHEVGDTFDAAKADADRWIQRGNAEAVSGGNSGGKGKGKSGDSGAQSGDSGQGNDNAAMVGEYRELHSQAIAEGTFEHAQEAEAQIRELGDEATADELKAVREQAEGGGA